MNENMLSDFAAHIVFVIRVNCLYFKIIISVCHSTNSVELAVCVKENVQNEMKSQIKHNRVPPSNEL